MILLQTSSDETLLPIDLTKKAEPESRNHPTSQEQPPLADLIPDEEEYFDFQI